MPLKHTYFIIYSTVNRTEYFKKWTSCCTEDDLKLATETVNSTRVFPCRSLEQNKIYMCICNFHVLSESRPSSYVSRIISDLFFNECMYRQSHASKDSSEVLVGPGTFAFMSTFSLLKRCHNWYRAASFKTEKHPLSHWLPSSIKMGDCRPRSIQPSMPLAVSVGALCFEDAAVIAGSDAHIWQQISSDR